MNLRIRVLRFLGQGKQQLRSRADVIEEINGWKLTLIHTGDSLLRWSIEKRIRELGVIKMSEKEKEVGKASHPMIGLLTGEAHQVNIFITK